MELALHQERDGSIVLCKLQDTNFAKQQGMHYLLVPYLTFQQVIQFVQSLDVNTFHAKRVKNSRKPLHWNIQVPSDVNKHGLRTIFKMFPNRSFDVWRIFACPTVVEAVIPTERTVLGLHMGPVKTFSLPSRPVRIQYQCGRPYRVIEWTPLAHETLWYIVRYHAGSLSIENQAYLEAILPPRSLNRRLLRIDDGDDFLTYVAKLPGKKMCVFTHENDDAGYVVPGVGRLQLFCWVAPWALAAKDKCNHFQVDASFKGSAPYAYYVPQAVIANRGLACGLVIAPTERTELYSAFDDLFGTTFGVPIVSDLGRAIEAYVNGTGLPHYFCHRHLLEIIGSSSYGAHLFGALLHAKSADNLSAMLPQFAADVAAFANSGLICPSTVTKFENYLGTKFMRTDSGLSGDIDGLDMGKIEKWVLYARGGCATCSNQAEAFHKGVNTKVRKDATFMVKLRNLVTCIQENKQTLNGRITDGIRLEQDHMAKTLQNLETAGVKFEKRDVCDCQHNTRNGLLYQTDGFCMHTIAAGKRATANEGCLLRNTDPVIKDEPPSIRNVEDIWAFEKRDKVKGNKPYMLSANDMLILSDSRLGRFIRSLSFLLEKSPTDAFDCFWRYVANRNIDPEMFAGMSPQELATIKVAIVLECKGQTPETTPSIAPGEVAAIYARTGNE